MRTETILRGAHEFERGSSESFAPIEPLTEALRVFGETCAHHSIFTRTEGVPIKIGVLRSAVLLRFILSSTSRGAAILTTVMIPLVQSIAGFRLGAGFRCWITVREEERIAGATDRHILGQCNFSQVARAPFESAMLGYSVDGERKGQGIMREALEAALDAVFSERCLLHRVQANVCTENRRRIAMLERRHFEREGRSRNYLFIVGA